MSTMPTRRSNMRSNWSREIKPRISFAIQPLEPLKPLLVWLKWDLGDKVDEEFRSSAKRKEKQDELYFDIIAVLSKYRDIGANPLALC